ncbi:efflux RND transporter periplasmic adaptor subunit [Sphingomonas sp. PvP056]|jgi:membrane fusion protein (multidrug efflux system)|uniref:efflux RND transporter periplasmic adaptor subunit n=1 Tax=Sphingomonas sp. PvP056 TaxID=3156392 RepID=UPI00263DAE71|nr:efflux RND transporter periplasmic adaptor subunit [Sphingomonas sp. PsM26]
MKLRSFPVGVVGALGMVALAIGGCAQKTETKGGRGGPKGPPEVGYIEIQTSSVPSVTELAARTSAYQMAEVRPQVTGLITKRLFTEGTIVKKGQALYQIDPRLYRASANQAAANLASAAANATATKAKADRYKPLADMQAVAAQDYTDAQGLARQAAASVQQTRAALETAQINLKFTTVPAPITGKIGRSLYTEGALVTSSQTDPLTVIQRLDPIFVDIQQASADLLRLRRALAGGGSSAAGRADVRLTLEDGSDYGQVGDVQFSEAMVDATTGTVTLRARFPNPQGLLLPGMFVRARFAQAIDNNAFLVPQQSVSRDAKGNATVFLVGPGNKAIQRNITATRTVGTNWVVTSGLKPGDKIITQGVGKVKPDQQVRPVPANAPQQIRKPGKDTAADQKKN